MNQSFYMYVYGNKCTRMHLYKSLYMCVYVSHITLVYVSHRTLVYVSHRTLVYVSHCTLVYVSHCTHVYIRHCTLVYVIQCTCSCLAATDGSDRLCVVHYQRPAHYPWVPPASAPQVSCPVCGPLHLTTDHRAVYDILVYQFMNQYFYKVLNLVLIKAVFHMVCMLHCQWKID